jgi:hypothetical protein
VPSPWGIRRGKDLRTISRELRLMGDGEITAIFRRRLRAAAAPLVPAVRQSALAIPAKTSARGRPGLRRAIARAVTLRVRTAGRLASVAIFVDGRKMPPRQGALPQYMEGTRRPWRHPVFGNTEVWRAQPAHPYFYRVVRPLGFASRVEINRAMDDITRGITGHTVLSAVRQSDGSFAA